MNAMTLDVKDALRRLDRMIDLYVTLFALTRRQAEIIESESDVDELIRLVGRKAAVMNDLDAVDRELDSFKREWRTLGEGLTPAQRAPVEERLSALLELIACVLLVEEQCEAALDEIDAPVAPATSTTFEARVAYAPSASAPLAATLDHRG